MEAGIYPETWLVFERETGYRRSAVRIDIRAECGHNWSLLVQQHKARLFHLARELSCSVDHHAAGLGAENGPRFLVCGRARLDSR
jgi:hypothetical protein